MTLTTGAILGPYEIVQAIGAGGMGQVYKARDTRLNRFVAIKVLPEHLSENAELKARFEREAQTLASLPILQKRFEIPASQSQEK